MVLQKYIWDKEYDSNKNKWKKETLNLPLIFKNKIVLEIGVGNGKTLISILNQKPKKVYAIDFSSSAIKYCKNKFDSDKVIFSEMDVIDLKFPPEKFDIIVCNYTLNNMLKKERGKAVSELYRVLKNKGIVLFEDFAKGDFRQENAVKYKEENTIVKKNEVICHFFTKNEIIDLFNRFSVKKIEIKITRPIKSQKEIKRKLISCTFEKNK